MCEALYLYGVMLLLVDEKIEGAIRERMLVAYYRAKGHTHALQYVDEVSKLLASTGYIPSQGKKPARYPEDLFARCVVAVVS